MLSNHHRIDNAHKPLVSCIVIFFNIEKDFFSEAIESVFSQTYKNWELLLIDDGSTNDSTQIAQSYTQKFPGKVSYLEHQSHINRGMSATRNLGIQNAKGKYIAFLDADDVWFSYKLEQQVEIMEAHPEAAMVYGKSLYWHSWAGNELNAQNDEIPDLFINNNKLYEPPQLLISCYPLGKATPPPPSNILIDRKALEAVGGFEEDFKGIYQMYEDQVLYAKLYLNFPVFVADKLWDKYRIHSDSCCANVSNAGKYESVRLYYLEWLEKYLNKHAVQDSIVWKMYNKAIFPYRHPHLYYFSHLARTLKVSFKKAVKKILKFVLPTSIQSKLKYQLIGKVKYGNLRRLTPISRQFGSDRGRPIDRYYIENFLDSHAQDIRGSVLEVGDSTYTYRFGGNRIIRSEVLHHSQGYPGATIIGDLTKADHIPDEAFDCIILTQTLQIIYNLHAALKTLYRILKPGGTLLVTVPGISQVVKGEGDNDYNWAFTSKSALLLFEEFYHKDKIRVESHGNVLAAISFLHGIASEELTEEELLYKDDEYQVTITVRAVK